jgi:hypothetical protein
MRRGANKHVHGREGKKYHWSNRMRSRCIGEKETERDRDRELRWIDRKSSCSQQIEERVTFRTTSPWSNLPVQTENSSTRSSSITHLVLRVFLSRRYRRSSDQTKDRNQVRFQLKKTKLLTYDDVDPLTWETAAPACYLFVCLLACAGCTSIPDKRQNLKLQSDY